ncbi:hypothetical protein SUGI_0602480 [Cryptomeria japonica]|nr:hypothetical protein SUGI_0602480 [Cryptomeria japonica]
MRQSSDASFFLAFHTTLSTTKTQATRSTPSAPACSDAFGSTTRTPIPTCYVVIVILLPASALAASYTYACALPIELGEAST